MTLLLDTSTAVAKLTIIDDGVRQKVEWDADRQLAKGLLLWITEQVQLRGKQLADIKGIAAYVGPGSFTGLRIGLTVLNTLADALSIPIVGEGGHDWQKVAEQRLLKGDNDKIVLPVYGATANITKPRK